MFTRFKYAGNDVNPLNCPVFHNNKLEIEDQYIQQKILEFRQNDEGSNYGFIQFGTL